MNSPDPQLKMQIIRELPNRPRRTKFEKWCDGLLKNGNDLSPRLVQFFTKNEANDYPKAVQNESYLKIILHWRSMLRQYGMLEFLVLLAPIGWLLWLAYFGEVYP